MARTLLRVSDSIDRLLRTVAHGTAYALIALTGIVVFEIVSRRLGWQAPVLTSSRLFELQWHLGTALFCGWMGHCYITGAHVRIEALTERLSGRGRLWLEVAGCLALALPFAGLLTWYGADYALRAFAQGESSDAPGGLPWRWVPKGILAAGFALLSLAVISVLMRSVAELSRPVGPAGAEPATTQDGALASAAAVAPPRA